MGAFDFITDKFKGGNRLSWMQVLVMGLVPLGINGGLCFLYYYSHHLVLYH